MSVLPVVSFAIFAFAVLYTLTTFALIGLSLVEVALTKVERGELFAPPRRLRRPGVSLIAPAFQMEPVIVSNVRSLLACDYEPLEVVIVDDGSTDGTTAALAAAFDLVELPVGDRLVLETAPIRRLLVSRADPRLLVVVKENGGRSDAVNAGLNVARHELVALVDTDTLLKPDALARIGEVFALDPDGVVAVGGTIRIANGAVIEDARVTEPRVPHAGVQATQTCEYLRGFLGGRVAWSRLNGLLIISGAFGVFRRDLLRAAGGLSKDTLGEDMELVLRLHHLLRPWLPRARVLYAPDACAWTEVPVSVEALRTQRIRWHVGLLENLRLHRQMLGRRRYGAVGMAALPYSVAFEVAGPILQVAGYAILAALVLLGRAFWWYAAAFLVVTVLAGQVQTAGAILIEEVGFRRYRTRDLMWLAGWSLVEVLWYRPLTAAWRVWATLLVAVGRRPAWGSLPRGVAISEQPAATAGTPLPR